jgi:hypothetical protein
MTNKTFAVAGVSTLKGVTKVRFANDMTRVKILAKGGHDNINLITLSNEMTKGDAVKALLGMDSFMSNPTYAEAIRSADSKYNGSVKVKKEMSMESITARVLEQVEAEA